MTQKETEKLRKKYPVGTRIELKHMEDMQAVPDGTLGTVLHVDDAGTIHMLWDNGRGLGLIEGEDEFHIMETYMEYDKEKVTAHSMNFKLSSAKERLSLNNIVIDNVITLSDEDYHYFKEHLNENYNFIRDNREILSQNGHSIQYLLIKGSKDPDAMIIQIDGRNTVENYCYIPYVEDLQKHFRYGIREEQQYTDAVFSCKDTEINSQRCRIEKIIELNHDDFNHFAGHLLSEYGFLKENRELMYKDSDDLRHCLLVIGNAHEHGILVDSSGASYARYTAFMPNTKAFIKQNQLANLIEDIYDLHHVKEEKIKVLVVEPQKKPRVEVIENTLDAKREIVQGEIELVELSDTADLICNEEGKYIGLEANRRFGNDVLVGTFLIVGSDGSEDFCSLSEEDIALYMERFGQIEDLKQEDIPEPAYKIYGLA